jgi:hypothetical protein
MVNETTENLSRERLDQVSDEIRQAYLSDSRPWIIGYGRHNAPPSFMSAQSPLGFAFQRFDFQALKGFEPVAFDTPAAKSTVCCQEASELLQ